MAFKTFIQKATEGNDSVDPLTHARFQRFSVGDFPREAILIKCQSKAVQVQAGFEWANDLMQMLGEILPEDTVVEGKGTVTSASKDRTKEIEACGITVKGVRGKKHTIEFKLSMKEFKHAVKELGIYSLLMSKVKVDGAELKMKTSPPKPGSLKEKFVTFKVAKEHEAYILETFLPELKGKKFKKAQIDHTFVIEDVVIPKEYENDFALARLHAIKKGKIKRVVLADDKEVLNTELEFAA